MKDAKAKSKKFIPTKRITHLKGETKIEKLNKEALKIIQAYRGSFG